MCLQQTGQFPVLHGWFLLFCRSNYIDRDGTGNLTGSRKNVGAGAPLRTTVDKLCALKADKAYGSDLLAQSALVELLVGLNRAAAERGDARPTGTSDQVVDAVLHYINEHYSEALTLDQLSEKFFISKYHLLRKFDAQVGTTVHRYILQKRLLNAKQLLAGGVPPNEVCQYCGFGDYANFYRAFRAEYNQTPRQYIQSARGK